MGGRGWAAGGTESTPDRVAEAARQPPPGAFRIGWAAGDVVPKARLVVFIGCHSSSRALVRLGPWSVWGLGPSRALVRLGPWSVQGLGPSRALIRRIPAEIQNSGGNPADSGGNPEIRWKSKCWICVELLLNLDLLNLC